MVKRFWPYVLMMAALFAAPLIAQVADSTVANPAVEEVGNLMVYAFAVLSAAVLGVVKKYTTLFDTAIGDKIKTVQPAIVWGLSLALPWAWSQLGLAGAMPSAEIMAAAPTATVVAVLAAEISARVFGKKKTPA